MATLLIVAGVWAVLVLIVLTFLKICTRDEYEKED